MANRWGILAALSFARVGMGFQFQTVAATAPLLSDRLGFDKAQIGWLIGLYLLPGVLVALPGGMLGARFGDKRMALIGLAMMILGGIGFAASESIGGASVARAVMGVGAVLMNVLLFKMTTEEGEVYLIDEIAGLQSLSDRNGNTLLVSSNGVVWTNSVIGGPAIGITFE